MVQEIPTAYDEVLYPSFPIEQTHPDRLATLAMLFGMRPQPVERCRVLELGCSEGGNLIPMALALPGSEFAGIDLASRPIARARELASTLKLSNVRFHQMDILELPPDFGEFDYIIAHGVYSWVPPLVRDKILEVCRLHLSSHGVGYISYNALPGGHVRAMLREMMMFHVRRLAAPSERVDQARELLRLLAEAGKGDDPYGKLLANEVERALKISGATLFHDDLAEINRPVYFSEFIEHANQHGLQYLAEADFYEMHDYPYPPSVVETLSQWAQDQMLREQYLDFIKCRRFRQTLLCHREVALERALRPERLFSLSVASHLRPVSPEPDLRSRAVEKFAAASGLTMETDLPLAKAVIKHLSEVWPRAVHFEDLLERVLSRLECPQGEDPGADARVLGEVLLKTYAGRGVELHAYPPRFVLQAGERPVASPLARLQAVSGSRVTTLRHTSLQIEDPLARHFIRLLDGTRDRESLLKELSRLVESGDVVVKRENQAIEDTGEAIRYLSDTLEEKLRRIARFALLLA